ncbi:MAG: acyl carrier protein [Proteobacteria bacterium]|jgi:acyl carrier protein|nr:acyl carrier protein [Pseudomonadota bacterium]
MNRPGVLDEMRRLLRERLRVEREITPETDLVADLALDSLKQLELLVEVENHFGVCLEAEADQEVLTIGDLVAWIERARVEEQQRHVG